MTDENGLSDKNGQSNTVGLLGENGKSYLGSLSSKSGLIWMDGLTGVNGLSNMSDLSEMFGLSGESSRYCLSDSGSSLLFSLACHSINLADQNPTSASLALPPLLPLSF